MLGCQCEWGMRKWTSGQTNLYQQLLPLCALIFFIWDIFFTSENVTSSCFMGRGGVWYISLHLWGKPKCMISSLRPVLWSFFGSHHNLRPFMCIDVKFVHKTQHLLTLFPCFFFFFTSLSLNLNCMFLITWKKKTNLMRCLFFLSFFQWDVFIRLFIYFWSCSVTESAMLSSL